MPSSEPMVCNRFDSTCRGFIEGTRHPPAIVVTVKLDHSFTCRPSLTSFVAWQIAPHRLAAVTLLHVMSQQLDP